MTAFCHIIPFDYDEVLLGYQPGQLVDYDQTITLRTMTENGLRNAGFFTAQSFGPADSLRELRHTQSPGKQQISGNDCFLPSYSCLISHIHGVIYNSTLYSLASWLIVVK
jgi:hypothetical protein